MKLVLLRLTDEPDKIECTLFNQQENNTSVGKKITIDEAITKTAFATSTLLVVPGLDVIALEKNLPKVSMTKLVKALPFAVEDQLLEPIDNYHFVITSVKDSGNVTLLSVLRNKMQQWLQSFHKRIIFSSMLPDYLLLPYEVDTWHIAIEKQVLIRTGLNLGLSCDLENWQQMVALLWQEQPLETQPNKLIIHNYLASPVANETDNEETNIQIPTNNIDVSLLNTLPISIEQKNETTALLNDMAKQAQHEMLTTSLLINEFAQEHHLSSVKKVWLFVGGMIATALIVSFFSTITQFLTLKRQDNLLQVQIAAIYKQIYPQSSSVVAPQVRMERTLSDLQKNQSSNGYLGLLALTSQVLKQFPTLQINVLRYQDNKLILEIQSNSFNTLDLARKKLEQAGVIATQDQGETKNNLITARFTIQEKP